MKQNSFSTQVFRNTKKLAIWTILWTGSLALATFGPNFIWDGNVLITVIAVVVNALLGIGMILMNIQYVNSLDELQKKIQLEAMGIALGVGVVGGLSYALLDLTNLISGNAEIGFLVIIISLAYIISVLIGQKRYN